MKHLLATEYPVIEEAKKTGRGNGIILEFIKSTMVLFVMICISGIITELLCCFIPEDAPEDPWANIVILYSEITSIVIGILYCTVCERRSLRSVGFSRPISKSYGMGVILGVLVFSLVVLISTICNGLHFSNVNTNVNILVQVLFLGGFIVQGLAEEVLCRGYIFVSMARKNNNLVASVASSSLFCLIHIFNDGFALLPMLNLILFGIFESLLFLKTNNIWAAGAFHSIWNYMQGCVFGLNVSGNSFSDAFFVFEQTENELANGGTFGPEGSVVVTVVLLAAMAVLVAIMHRENEGKQETTIRK